MQEVQHALRENLTRAKEDQARFYNKDKRVDVTYAPGDWVWLSRKYIKTRRQNSKLDVQRLGPFRVRRMVGKNAAELDLTQQFSRLHPVFNVSLLMPYLSQEDPPAGTIDDAKQDFLTDFVDWASTEYIMDYRCLTPDIHEYLIREHGTSTLDDEWKLLTTLSPHLDQFLQNFHARKPSRGEGPSSQVWQQRASTLV